MKNKYLKYVFFTGVSLFLTGTLFAQGAPDQRFQELKAKYEKTLQMLDAGQIKHRDCRDENVQGAIWYAINVNENNADFPEMRELFKRNVNGAHCTNNMFVRMNVKCQSDKVIAMFQNGWNLHESYMEEEYPFTTSLWRKCAVLIEYFFQKIDFPSAMKQYEYLRNSIPAAVSNGDLEIIHRLLALGADPNGQILNKSAIEVAVEENRFLMVQLLYDHGGNVGRVNRYLFWAVIIHANIDMVTFLITPKPRLEVQAEDIQKVLRMLSERINSLKECGQRYDEVTRRVNAPLKCGYGIGYLYLWQVPGLLKKYAVIEKLLEEKLKEL